MVDVTQTMACIQCGACVSDCLSMEVDPLLHRPGGAGQGLPLRRRPARRPAVRAPQRPRRGPAGHLRLHALLQVRRGLPQGRQPDGPDHAPAPHRAGNDHHIVDRNNGERHEAAFTTLIKRQRPAVGGRAAAALLRRRLVVRQVRAARRQGAAQLAARRSPRRCCAARSRRWAR